MNTTPPSPEQARRVWIDKQTPTAFSAAAEAANAVKAVAEKVGFDRRLVELLNVRVSQLNSCAYCLDVHTRAAIAAGETQQRLYVLSAWRRSELFTVREQAALVLAEVTTTLPDEATIEREYQFARSQLSDDEVSVVVWIATTMNTFNRVSIMSKHPVRPRKEQ